MLIIDFERNVNIKTIGLEEFEVGRLKDFY